MARTLADLTDAELEAQFVEAERNALAWTELGLSDVRGARWMAIAAPRSSAAPARGADRPSRAPARRSSPFTL